MEQYIKDKKANNEESFLLNYDLFADNKMPKFYATYEIQKYFVELEEKRNYEKMLEEKIAAKKKERSPLIRSFSFAKDDPDLKPEGKSSIEELPIDKLSLFKISLRQLRQLSRCKQTSLS